MCSWGMHQDSVELFWSQHLQRVGTPIWSESIRDCPQASISLGFPAVIICPGFIKSPPRTWVSPVEMTQHLKIRTSLFLLWSKPLLVMMSCWALLTETTPTGEYCTRDFQISRNSRSWQNENEMRASSFTQFTNKLKIKPVWCWN